MYRLRSRIVNFRVTEDELEQLKTASELQGARCLSEFARSVMLETAHGSSSQYSAPVAEDDRLRRFEQRLSAVESNVSRIANALESFTSVSVKSEA